MSSSSGIDPVDAPVTTFVTGSLSLLARLPGLTERVLVDGTGYFSNGGRVLSALADAIDDGLLDELRAVLRAVEPASGLVPEVAAQLERTLPLLEQSLDTLVPLAEDALTGVNRAVAIAEHLPSAVEELRLVRTAAERMARAVAAAGLEPLELIPGAGVVRRQLAKVVPRTPGAHLDTPPPLIDPEGLG
jgi:hypothetical protein